MFGGNARIVFRALFYLFVDYPLRLFIPKSYYRKTPDAVLPKQVKQKQALIHFFAALGCTIFTFVLIRFQKWYIALFTDDSWVIPLTLAVLFVFYIFLIMVYLKNKYPAYKEYLEKLKVY